MRSILISMLPAAAFAGIMVPRAPQTAPQSGHDNTGPFGPLVELLKSPGGLEAAVKAIPIAKLVDVRKLDAQVRPEAKRILARYGPYTLAGKGQPKPPSKLTNSLDPNGQASLDLITDGLCRNCTILRGKTGLEALDGTTLGPPQGIYLHHIVTRDLTKPPNLPVARCGAGQTSSSAGMSKIGAEFLAQGDDGLTGYVYFTSTDGKFASGYQFGDAPKILAQIDLVNYGSESRDVYVTYEIEYVDGLVGDDSAATLMSVAGCGQTFGGTSHDKNSTQVIIQLDKNGPSTTESPKFPFSKNGKIVAAGGHMHDGAVKMILLINEKEVCNAEAVYGKGGDNNEETILRVTPCPTGIDFKKGDIMTMKSVYDLKKHPLRAGSEHNSMGGADVMGMFYMTFAVDK